MITPEFVRMMGRYNQWQNRQITGFVRDMDAEALLAERGAFFGTIFGTLNHLLWGDQMWMSRFDPNCPPPGVDSSEHTRLTPDLPGWMAARQETDALILGWADQITAETLAGDLTWFSGITGRQMVNPMGQCVVHFFNHQTHHRGQVHAMLTSAGSEAPVSDLTFMPEA